MRSTAIGFTEQNGLEKVVDGVPIGAIIPYAGSTAPFGTLICNGAAISRSAYPELFDAIGTTWGAGDGSTTFNIPDLRGYFLRGVGGNSAGLAAEQGDAIRNITGELINLVCMGAAQDNGGALYAVTSASGSTNATGTPTGGVGSNHYTNVNFEASRDTPIAVENRPINKAVNYCIRYA